MGRIKDFDNAFAQLCEGARTTFFINSGTLSLYSFVNFICISRNLKFANRNLSISKCLWSLGYGQLLGTFCQGLIKFVPAFWENWLKRVVITRDSSGASVGTLDLIDPLWNRKAKVNHDKAFALRNILQKVKGTDIPMPNYSHSLDKVYESLNLDLAKTRRCRQMLAIASFNHLSGYPSWMPDWSKQADTFWLEDSTQRAIWESPVEDRLYDRIGMDAHNVVYVDAFDVFFVERCFKFFRTENTYNSDERNIHLKNLEISLGLVRCRSRIRERDQKGIKLPSEIWDHLTEVCLLAAPGLRKMQVRKWIYFLRDSCKLPTESVFLSLLADSELFRTQVSICNSLSEKNRQIFWCWMDLDIGPVIDLIRRPLKSLLYLLADPWYAFGICSSAVRPGYLLVTIDGVSIQLIVEPRGSPHPYVSRAGRLTMGARIVSPVRARGHYPKTPPDRWNRHAERMTLCLS